MMAQTSGVLSHKGKEGLRLDGVKGTGNGLESRRYGNATVCVIRYSGFNKLPKGRPREAAGLEDNRGNTVKSVLTDFDGLPARSGSSAFPR